MEDLTIFEESEIKLEKGDEKEMLNIIYDTLFKNTRMPQFSADIDGEIDNSSEKIYFSYCGHEYELSIKLL